MKRLKGRKTIYILAGALACTGCLIMMVFPAIALNAAQKGISLWASSVLPALLPFFICANFMTALGLPSYMGRIFEKPFQKIFGAPGVSAFVFSVSITSGYPMGAKLIGDFGRSRSVTLDEAKSMLTFCSTSGPLFMLGAVGAGMLGSPAAGAVIALSHYAGALLNGILYRIISPVKNHSVKRNLDRMSLPKGSILDLFTDSLLSSFRALGIICGYIVLFMMITEFIQFSGVLNFVSSDYGKGVIKGLLEMTVGCSGIARSSQLTLLYQSILCTFLISFGGFSVYAQSMSMLSGLRIGAGFYLFSKLSHGILAAMIAWLIGPMLLGSESVTAGAFGTEEFISSLGFFSQLLFSTKMVIMIVILFLTTIVTDQIFRKHKQQKNKENS
jgi:sporulation integral membrane protein YlbJ